MTNYAEKAIGIVTMIIIVAIIAVIVSARSQSANVITAAAKALSTILGVVVAPVGGSGSGGAQAGAGASAQTGYSGMMGNLDAMRNQLLSGNAGQSLSAYIGALGSGHLEAPMDGGSTSTPGQNSIAVGEPTGDGGLDI